MGITRLIELNRVKTGAQVSDYFRYVCTTRVGRAPGGHGFEAELTVGHYGAVHGDRRFEAADPPECRALAVPLREVG